ncbi:hypothetical protein DB347_14420 [Opitutaceae bacterium EW11]|nr:hypothetical protein DB347_14420 [Opitutaceae bacterium EW11]
MATQEFYIRTASETEAHGPFTQEQLTSLAEAGKVDPQTLYYEATTEQWVTISSNPDLKAAIFPEKKRLTIKPKDRIATLNEGPDTNPPITVNEMLAAAEGRTADTRDKRDRSISMERAAKYGRYACTLMLLASAITMLLPSIDLIASMDTEKLVLEPFVYLGVLDLGLTLLLLLGMVSVYPFIRFRAMLALGFLGLIFWSQGQLVPLVAVAAGSAGLYLTTVFLNYAGLALSIGLGLTGMLGLAYYLLT